MTNIDDKRPFLKVNIAILTISDTRTIETDKSGDLLSKRINESGHCVIDRFIVKDDKDKIRGILLKWVKDKMVDVVISTGGTGITGKDLTPEVFSEILEKEIPGFGELFRWLSYKKIGTSSLQSRASAGVCKGTYLFSLPGSTGACRDAWDQILIYQLDNRFRPCNLVELMPRLREHEQDQ